ncbi:MAG TPA: hypothetical protein VFJ58_21475 [Armatimonadota bacterium]|nr:hypothetical protein [Armatimonadota bacterium]
MKTRQVSVLATLAMFASCASAFAMQPAQAKAGLEYGGEIGAGIGHGTKFAGAADVDYGFRTNFLQSPYTEGVVDFLSTARNIGPFSLRENLLTVGVRQPLPLGGTTPISIEGGLSNLGLSDGGSTNDTSGFIGGRATFAQGGTVGITAMGRYHFEDGGFYQVGAGLTGPLGHGSGAYYQADYYHIGGTGGANTDTIMVGVRFSGK